jgi:hypothetical protein
MAYKNPTLTLQQKKTISQWFTAKPHPLVHSKKKQYSKTNRTAKKNKDKRNF